MNMDRWMREISVPLVAEEIAALLGDTSGEARDADGRWSKSGAPGSHHGSKKNMIRQNAESHAAYASKVLKRPDVGSMPAEVVRAAQKIADHKRGGIDALTPHEAHSWHGHVEGRINHEGAVTDMSETVSVAPTPAWQSRPYKDRNKPVSQAPYTRKSNENWAHHADEALLGPLYDAAHKIEAMLAGKNQSRGEDGKWTKKPDAKRCGKGKGDWVDRDLAHESKKSTEREHEAAKSHTYACPSCKKPKSMVHKYSTHSGGTYGYSVHHYSCKSCKSYDAINSVPKKGIKHAAEEIAALFAGQPHDVSGEARDHGQFAKTPGAGAANEPTGSPLDPATGAKPPPAEHEVHKSNMDLHSKAAKTYNALVKQHLDLAKIALSPEDRARHIEAARSHKQTAAHHTEQAGAHAEKMTAALQKAMQQVPTLPTAKPGLTPGQPAAAAPTPKPNATAQGITGGIGSTIKKGVGIVDSAINANEQPGMITDGAEKGIDAARKAVHAPAKPPPPIPTDPSQLPPRKPTFAPSGEKQADDYKERQAAGRIGAQKGMGAAAQPPPEMTPEQKAQSGQKARDVIARQFPNMKLPPPKISHTTPSGQDVPASTGTGMTHGPAVRREQERQEYSAAMNRPNGLDPKKLEEARRTREATNSAMGHQETGNTSYTQPTPQQVAEQRRVQTGGKLDPLRTKVPPPARPAVEMSTDLTKPLGHIPGTPASSLQKQRLNRWLQGGK